MQEKTGGAFNRGHRHAVRPFNVCHFSAFFVLYFMMCLELSGLTCGSRVITA